MSLAREYGAAVDLPRHRRGGPGPHRRLEVPRSAKRIYDLAVERYGIEPTDLIFDCLTFPLGSGQEDLRQRRHRDDRGDPPRQGRAARRRRPILGVSNVSFGLKPAIRHVLNSVFLHECVRGRARRRHRARGPHHADAQDRRPRARARARPRLRPARATATTRSPSSWPLFEGVEAGAVEREDRSGWPVEERLKHRIIDGDRDGLEADLDEQLASLPALAIINDVLLDGMKVVGDLFGSGEMQLPFVLQSAETMKTAVAHLEPHMEKADAGGKGRVVIGTVKGDVHDIGKNLVDIILTNNGYEVHNIGIKAPLAGVRRQGRTRSRPTPSA